MNGAQSAVVPAKAGTSEARRQLPNRSPAKAGAQYLEVTSHHKKLGSCLRRRTGLALPLLLTACTSVELPAGPAPFDPIAFFSGETRGTGTLRPIVGRSAPITVESRGTREGTGLRLVQRITEGAKPPRTRTWIMRPAGPGRFTGTLTDAEGPVAITVEGSRATISYRTPSGIGIRQQLALQADGRTVLNHLEAYKYGVRVATLEETIRRPLAQ
jgi:hypothetical protein